MANVQTLKPGLGVPQDDDDGPLYVARRKIYPKAVAGFFRQIKWALLIVTLAVYYITPFIRWDRGPGAPGQAVLIDLQHNRFYFFFIEIWPQEFYYITGLLVLAALALFLMNAVAGRIWCGYLCPQTVWTDLFYLVERWTEGDQRAHAKMEAAGWTAERIVRSGAKHFIWLMIAWWTGGAWVLYFSDAPTLVYQLATLQAPPIAWICIGVLTATTYIFAGHMREQVCVYMCPWPRIQAALTDEYALNVTYRVDRGEPRGSVKKSHALVAAGEKAGDCVDCYQCVAVCPTGIDIRDGAQLECIQCGLCIDACDSMMVKLGQPTMLIAYDTQINIDNRQQHLPEVFRILRPRTIVYGLAILGVGGLMLGTLAMRKELSVTAIHDRNPVFVKMADGSIRNAYSLRMVNKGRDTRRFAVSVEGLPGAVVTLAGLSETDQGSIIEVGPDQTAEARALVTVRPGDLPASTEIGLRVTQVGGATSAVARDTFKAP